jgi:hypothetical protein
MKMLLDENLPHRLHKDFPSSYEIYSAQYMGWLGLKNGDLLAVMAKEGFEVLITWDKNLQFQQNFTKYSITVFCFHTPFNKYQLLKEKVPLIVAAIEKGIQPGLVIIK